MAMSKVNFYDIYIHFNDDIMLEPSFSVNYKDESASYNFKKLKFDYAFIPKDQQRLVNYWAHLHQRELMDHYHYIKKVNPLANIENLSKIREIHIKPLDTKDKLGIIFVWYQEDYKLIIWFSNMERKLIDIKKLMLSDEEKFKRFYDIDYYESYKVNPYSITWDTEIKLTAKELYNIAEPLPNNVDFKELDKGILDEIAEEQERLKRENHSFTSDVGSCFWGCLAFPITLPARILWFILRKARIR